MAGWWPAVGKGLCRRGDILKRRACDTVGPDMRAELCMSSSGLYMIQAPRHIEEIYRSTGCRLSGRQTFEHSSSFERAIDSIIRLFGS